MSRIYIIHAPYYRYTSAGVKVLYELSWQLNQHGYESYVFCPKQIYPIYRYNLCSKDFMIDALSQGAWVIYGEVVRGNPLGAKNVIRYVLNVPGKIGGNKEYDKNEVLFAYNSYVSERAWNCPVLKTPHVNLNICKDYGLVRHGSCFYVGRAKDVKRRPELEEIEIANLTSQQLYDLFNRVEVFYTYEDMTSCCEEARLCGCPVVILNENSDKLELLKENKYGMAFGLSELEWARQTVHKFRQLYIEQYHGQFEKQLELFLEITE